MKPGPPSFRPAWRFVPARSARETVLAEWRGADWGPLEKGQRLAARATAELVPAVLKQIGWDRRHVEAELLKSWPSLLDPNVTAHAQPTGLRNGTLFVSVDSSVWLEEIVRYRRKEILERLQHAFGKEMVKKISFRAG